MNRYRNMQLGWVAHFACVSAVLFLLILPISGCKSGGGESSAVSNPFASSKEKKSAEFQKQVSSLEVEGENLIREKKPQEARIVYQKIIKLYDENPGEKRSISPYCRLGVLEEGFGQFAEAEKLYQQAMKVDEKVAMPYNCLGYCYFQQGRLDDALKLLQKAVELEPSDQKFNNNLGLIYGMKHDYDKAFECFRRVTTEADAYYNMSTVFAMNGEEKEAKLALQRTVELDPNHREAQRLLLTYREYEQGEAEYSTTVQYRDSTDTANSFAQQGGGEVTSPKVFSSVHSSVLKR